jgi:hypothetical protein
MRHLLEWIDLPLSLDVLKSAAEASTMDQQKLVLE